MERDLERIEEAYADLARDNVKSLVQVMAEDVEVVQSPELPWGGRYLGHSGVKEFLGAMAVHLDWRVSMERLIDSGDQVVAVGRATGKTRSTKLEFEVPVVHVWTMREGQVIRLEIYLDNGTLLAALTG